MWTRIDFIVNPFFFVVSACELVCVSERASVCVASLSRVCVLVSVSVSVSVSVKCDSSEHLVLARPFSASLGNLETVQVP